MTRKEQIAENRIRNEHTRETVLNLVTEKPKYPIDIQYEIGPEICLTEVVNALLILAHGGKITRHNDGTYTKLT